MSYGASRRNKIDLMNSRLSLDCTTSPDRLFDSLEHSYNPPKTVCMLSRKSSRKERNPQMMTCRPRTALDSTKVVARPMITASRTITDRCKTAKLPTKGVDFSSSPSSPHDMYLNRTAFTLQRHKPRIDSETLNRVLDRVHEPPQYTREWSLQKELQPCHWSKSKVERDRTKPTTDKGPGEYDVNRWDHCERGTLTTPLLVKFLKAPRDDSAIVRCTTAPPPTAYFQDISYKPQNHPSAILKSSVPERFGKTYEHEKYISTTGLLLSHDFDHKSAWDRDIPITMHKKIPIKSYAVNSEGAALVIIPDSGTKLSFKKSVETSPIKYAAAFSKKVTSSRFHSMQYSNELIKEALPK